MILTILKVYNNWTIIKFQKIILINKKVLVKVDNLNIKVKVYIQMI